MKTKSEVIEYLLSLLPPEKTPKPGWYWWLTFAGSVLFFSVVVSFFSGSLVSKIYFVLLCSSVSLFCFWSYERNKIRKVRDTNLTTQLLPLLFEELLPGYTFQKNPSSEFIEPVIAGTGILKYARDNGIRNMFTQYKYGSIHVDEMITGMWGEDKIRLLDVTLTCVYAGQKTDTVWTDDMLVVAYPYPKKFHGTTIVAHKNTLLMIPKGLEKVSLESSRFERQFTVYSDDQIEARFCIHTDTQERLSELSDANSGMILIYSSGYVFVILPHYKNLFNVGTGETTRIALIRAYDSIATTKNLLISIKAKLDIVDVLR